MSTMSIFETKTHLSRLVLDLSEGRDREVVITKHGKPVAEIKPVRAQEPSRRIGIARGRFKAPKTMDKDNPTIERMFHGVEDM